MLSLNCTVSNGYSLLTDHRCRPHRWKLNYHHCLQNRRTCKTRSLLGSFCCSLSPEEQTEVEEIWKPNESFIGKKIRRIIDKVKEVWMSNIVKIFFTNFQRKKKTELLKLTLHTFIFAVYFVGSRAWEKENDERVGLQLGEGELWGRHERLVAKCCWHRSYSFCRRQNNKSYQKVFPWIIGTEVICPLTLHRPWLSGILGILAKDMP